MKFLCLGSPKSMFDIRKKLRVICMKRECHMDEKICKRMLPVRSNRVSNSRLLPQQISDPQLQSGKRIKLGFISSISIREVDVEILSHIA